ncbi:MAG: NAD-dependent epimerase/dehydratase family protein [Burkholderiales bacterium]|nr:NAD-dependent epimerase/dehydratase family protein [Burkholderiales bacterium]
MVVSPSERVLVTGAGGFTGRHLCAHLHEHGYRVFGLTEHAGDAIDGNAQVLHADLLDASAMAAAIREAAPSRVVHLAAIAFPGHAQAEAIYRVNVVGTLTLLEALARSGLGRNGILLPSTGTVYGRAAASALDESAPLVPSTHYAVSKLAMEHLARLFADTLPIVVVRPFNYTGPGQREPYLVPKLVRHFAQRAPFIELGNVDIERDFLDVRTVVDVYRRLLDAPAAIGGTFNLCSGAATSLRSLLSMLEAATGHRIEVRVNPQFVREGEPPRIVGSPARLTEVIGELRQLPLPVTLADMLCEYA